MPEPDGYTRLEMMAIAAGREIRDGEIAIFGVGLAMLAGYFAKAFHAPNVRAMTGGQGYRCDAHGDHCKTATHSSSLPGRAGGRVTRQSVQEAPSPTLPRKRGRERSVATREEVADCRVKPGGDETKGSNKITGSRRFAPAR